MFHRLLAFPVVVTIARRGLGDSKVKKFSKQNLLASSLWGWPTHIGNSSWTFDENDFANRILEDSQALTIASLVGASVGVGKQSGYLEPDYASILTTENSLEGSAEYQTVTHYVYLGDIAQRLPRLSSSTDVATTMNNWATYFAEHPTQRPAGAEGSYSRILELYRKEPEVYAPLLVAYGLHNNAQGKCSQKNSIWSRYQIFTLSEQGKPCLRVDLTFVKSSERFRIFLLYQNNKGIIPRRQASFDVEALQRISASSDQYEFQASGTLQLQEYGRTISYLYPQKAREFGLTWDKEESGLLKERKAIVLIHAVACGWPSYLKGYTLNGTM